MDLVTLTVLITSTLGAIMIHLVSSELYGLGAAIARKLIEKAAARLPEQERDRYREEWLAHYRECPGTFAKLWHAMGCMSASSALTRQSAVRIGEAAKWQEICNELGRCEAL